VRQVEQVLVVGVGVGRGHQAVLDAEVVEQDLRHRREAVGRAAAHGYDVIRLGVVVLVVDAEHDGPNAVALAGRAEQDLLGARVQVPLGLVGRDEEAGALEDHVDPFRLPGDFLGVPDFRRLDGPTRHLDGPGLHSHVVLEHSERGVVLQQVR
jgi:hypothetical protein